MNFSFENLYANLLLAQGQVFVGQYALWYEQNTNLFKIKVISGENEVTYVGMPGGFASGYFNSNNTLSQDKNRISNVTACFDNQSVLVLGYQDNGDSNVGYTNKPYINIGYSGGARLTGWRGWNPELFNNVQVNYPYSMPNVVTGQFFTGLVGCYYTDQVGGNLYARYQNDNFSTEFLINSGLTPAQNQRFGYNLSTTVSPYNQFKKVILRKDSQGNIISIASKPTIYYAFDSFDKNNLETRIDYFSGGYGRWKNFNVFLPSSGISYYPDYYFYDTVDYNTGSIVLLNSGTTIINYSGSKVGQTIGSFLFSDNYFYDSFDLYLIESLNDSGLISGISLSGYFNFTGLRTGITFFGDPDYSLDSGTIKGSWEKTSEPSSYYNNGYSGFLQGSGMYVQNGGYFSRQHNSQYLLNNFSVECWFARSGWANTFARIIDKGSVGGFGFYRTSATDTLSFSCSSSFFSTSYAIPDLTWTHAAFVRSGTTASVFFNGEIAFTGAVTSAALTSTSPILLGYNGDNPNEWFRGSIDEFRLWSYARSSGEIASNYNQIITPRTSGLLSYYRVA